MRKTVCFHVGLPKTGTTTIQQYLRSQDDKLRAVGFLYPGPREHPAFEAHHNHPMMFNAMTGEARVASGGLDAEACREVVATAFEKFHQSDLAHLIWSFETIALGVRNWDMDYLERILDGADVRIVFFARYTDEWVESLVKQNVWTRAGPRGDRLYGKPLRPRTRPTETDEPATGRPDENTLARGLRINAALRIMGTVLPSAEIIVRSFDTNRQEGKVVSGALAAMGVPVEDGFADADDDAGVKNPTKSDLHSMLLYHLEIAQAGRDVVRDVAAAIQKRNEKGLKFERLNGQHFRFLSDENVSVARGYYENLRHDYPNLPMQPPYVHKPAERSLPKDQGVALLDWLRPDISDAIFDKACAAYPAV